MTSATLAEQEAAAGLTPQKQKGIIRRLFTRVWWLMFCTSYTKQQGTTTVWVLEPFLADIYGKGTDEYYDALQRHQNFFNTTPMFASFIFAIVISMEYERKAALDRGEEYDDASIEAIKVALMGPIAGIGDSIQLSVLRVIATGVAIGFSQQGSWLGPILFALIYNVPNQIIHWYCGSLGMKLGTGFVTEAMESGKMEAFTKGFTVLGMIMVGAMTAKFVTVTTTLKVATGGATFNLQSTLDSIMPGLVPLAITLGCFAYVRKSTNKNSAMIALGVIILACIVLTLLGVTGGAA
ncbi:MAG: PTS system mannose/fructose/sorbose family transporter subunit IID [Atopobiaceae bacterium]